MLQKCKAIVLKLTKYSESSIIINCYTDVFGKASFIINGVHSKKSKNRAALFQTLSLLELEIYYKENRDVHRIKDVRIYSPFVSITTDILKSSIAFFLAEILLKTLGEHENNLDLFTFIENSIIKFDLLTNQKEVSNFHLLFLIQLTRYLGFFPTLNYSSENQFFDLKAGRFVSKTSLESFALSQYLSSLFVNLFDSKAENRLSISRKDKSELLNSLIEYYNLHLDTNIKLKSVEVLAELFD